MVVIIYCCIGYEDEVTTLKVEHREDHDVDIFIIQKVQDTVIHLEVDEEQWEITQGSKASGKNRVPRSILVRATTHRCSSYIDLAMVPR